MLKRVMSTDSQLWSQLQHSLQQINTTRVDLWQDDPQVLSGVHLEILLVFGVLRDTRPGSLGWGTHDAEDAHKLIFVCSARKERSSSIHLRHDAAGRPDVDACVVCSAPKQHVRCSIPERDNFVGERIDWDTKCSCQAKVGKLKLTFVVDEQILGLQVAVEHSVCMAVVDTLEQLMHKRFDGDWVQCSPIALRIHVFLQILIHIFEDKHELILSVNDIVEAKKVLVLQFFHQRDLTYGCRWRAFLRVEMNFLQRNQFPSLSISSFENSGVGSFS